MVTAVIVAAGKSRRMGRDKLFAPLCGEPLIAHTIGVFDRCGAIDSVVLVAEPDRLPEFEAVVATYGFEKVAKVVPGGNDRHLSVWAGLQAIDPRTEFVAIHDGARPLTTPAMIVECLEVAREMGASCCATPVPDTVKRADDDGHVKESVERSGLWAMQTPQVFRTGIIVHAYKMLIAANQKVTDEVSAVQRAGRAIQLICTQDWNFKVTLPKDLVMAEQVLISRNQPPLRPKRARQSRTKTKAAGGGVNA
jgi:2-C-methyl-D-erythritol 4-phosphate cytidylyltransferase